MCFWCWSNTGPCASTYAGGVGRLLEEIININPRLLGSGGGRLECHGLTSTCRYHENIYPEWVHRHIFEPVRYTRAAQQLGPEHFYALFMKTPNALSRALSPQNVFILAFGPQIYHTPVVGLFSALW